MSPAGRSQPSFGGYIRETAVVIIAIEAVGRALAFGKAFQFRAVYQKDVWPTVIVVIEDRDSVASGLDNIFLGVDPAKDVRRRETAFLSDIREIRNGSGRSGSRFRPLRG